VDLRREHPACRLLAVGLPVTTGSWRGDTRVRMSPSLSALDRNGDRDEEDAYLATLEGALARKP
jgi:hypothetical protein